MNREFQAQEKLVCKKGKTSEQQECALRLGPEKYPQFSFLFRHTGKTHSYSLYEKTTVM